MGAKVNGGGTEDLSDLPVWMAEVAERHGRALTSFVMAAGMGQNAAQVLSTRTYGWPEGAHALEVLARNYNEIATALAEAKGWSSGKLAEVDRDLQLAFASRIEVPGRKIIVEH